MFCSHFSALPPCLHSLWLKIAYWLHGLVTWEREVGILLSISSYGEALGLEAVKDLHLYHCNWTCWTFTLFLEAPTLAMLHCSFASSHHHKKTVKQNVLPSGRTYAKIPLTAWLWEALKMKELRNPKAFLDCESPSEMSPRKTRQVITACSRWNGDSARQFEEKQ